MKNGFELVGAGASFRGEICDMIAGTQLFSDLPWQDIEGLAAYLQCYRVAAETAIFAEGDPGSYMCLLVSGQVDIIKTDSDGCSHRMLTIARGKTIGEMSIIDGEPRSATCMAAQESVLLLLTKEHYKRIIQERPALAVHILAKLAKLMSQRLRAVSGQLVEFLE